LIQLYSADGKHTTFKTFQQWKEEGKFIIRGSKAFTVWGSPKKAAGLFFLPSGRAVLVATTRLNLALSSSFGGGIQTSSGPHQLMSLLRQLCFINIAINLTSPPLRVERGQGVRPEQCGNCV